MRILIAITALTLFGCSSDDDKTPTPQPDASSQADASGDSGSADAATGDASGDAAADAAQPDAAASFCATADCAPETPICVEVLQLCVECASDTDCTTAPNFTCENVGVDGADPSYACVECKDDSVCAGGTCDLTTHTCML